MEVCTVEISQDELVTEDADSVADPAVTASFEEPRLSQQAAEGVDESPGLSSDEDLEVQDESLNLAARLSRSSRPNRNHDRLTWVAAFLIAVVIHGAAVAICLMLAIVIHLPRLSFTQGSGSSESGLVAENSHQAESQESGVPGPPGMLPEPAKVFKSEPRAVSEVQSDPFEQFPPVTIVDPEDQSADRVIIGIAADPVGPPPVLQHNVPKQAVASNHQAPPAQPISHPAAIASASAASGKSVASRHVFVAPRGAGHPGIGSEGSGTDSRGLPVPEYPPESRRRREQGEVELEVQVKADGTVADAHIIKDSGYPRLNKAALASIGSAKFTPATEDGVPIAIQVIVPYRFILQ